MEYTYMAVILTVLAGGEPEFEMVPQRIYLEESDCMEWKANMETLAPRPHASGRPVMTRQFICRLLDIKQLQGMIDTVTEEAKAKGL